MIMKLISYFFAFFFAFFVQKVHAQVGKDSAFSLQEVKVESSKSEVRLLRLPYLASISTRKDLEKNSSRTIAESLFGLPGILIQKSNYGGGAPFLRGLTGNQNLIMVDGIRLNNSIFRYGPNQYLSLVEAEWLEKLEILKGTGSVQFGSDAMTGVIYLKTKELNFSSTPTWSGHVLNRITNRDMESSFRTEFKYEGKKTSLALGMSKKKFGDLYGGGQANAYYPTGYNDNSYDAKIKMDVGNNWIVNAGYQFLQQKNVPTYFKYIYENYALNISNPIQRGMGYVRLNKSFHGIISSMKYFASIQDISEQRFLQKNANPILRKEHDRTSTVSGGFEMNLAFSNRWSSTNGIDFYHDYIKSSRNDINVTTNVSNSLRGLYPNGSSYNNLSLYTLHHFKFGKLNAELGIRYSGYNAIIHEITLGKVSTNPNALTSQLGLNYLITPKLAVFGHLSEGFRAPNIDDMGTLGIVDFRYEIPAYDLKPEHALNKEVGVKYFSDRINSSVSFFHISLHDLITRVKTGQQNMSYDVYMKENIDRGNIYGNEASILWKLSKHLTFQGNYTFLTGFSTSKNEPLRRIPPASSRLSVEYGNSSYHVGLNYDHSDPQRKLAQGDKDDVRIGKSGTEGFNVLHFYSGFQVNHFKANIFLNNLLDIKYKMHGSGIDEIGRSFTISGVLFF